MGHYQSDSCCKTSTFQCARTMTMHWTARADSDLHREHESLPSCYSASSHKSYQQRKGGETRNPSLPTASQCSQCPQLASWHFLLGIFCCAQILAVSKQRVRSVGIQLTDTRRQLHGTTRCGISLIEQMLSCDGGLRRLTDETIALQRAASSVSLWPNNLTKLVLTTI